MTYHVWWGLLLLLAGCMEVSQELSYPLTLRTLAKGSYSGVRNRLEAVIKTEQDWQALWDQHTAIMEPRKGLPPVDFTREMVLAVFMGEQRTGGAIVEVLEVTQEGKSLLVHVSEVSAPAKGVGLAVLTQPHHFVVVPHSDLQVKFDWRQIRR